ncbi:MULTISPECIES: hypothetical protein [Bacillus cereus group]|uniref:Uncharacterized protein n=1 Tax=Bacillus thuringiensis TaxID=1428 RepID=A0A9X7FY51_BACTU|nr:MULTISPECIES: hypothetical protein [Bacillus cereus group]PFT50874.1 hypothetical protein COK72_02375 [Bacillus thuringiensis]PFY22911.1 hypothetical protein COL44_18695 [Bacillus toyonensis]
MTYTLVNFKSNNNSSNWQQDYIGQKFTVQGAEIGLYGVFALVDGSGYLRTSMVVDVARNQEGGMIVATRNSTYEFEAVK